MSTEVPLARRLVQVTCAITWCLLAAGPVFGFAALKPILIKEGVYADRCSGTKMSGFGQKINDDDSVIGFGYSPNSGALYPSSSLPCTDQDLLLNFMFTMAAVITNVAALPVGSILDVYGPRVCGLIGSVLIFVASLLLKSGKYFATSEKWGWFDAYLVGYTILALGGPFVFISSFQLANSFPKNSGLILALLTGAFDSSLALFLFYRLFYTQVHKLSLDTFFSWYLVVPLFIFVSQILIMPRDSYKTMGTLAKIGEMAIDETGRPLDTERLLPEDRAPSFSEESRQNSGVFDNSALFRRRESLHRRGSVISRALYTLRVSIKSVYEVDAEQKLVESSGGVFGIMHGYSVPQQLKLLWFILMTLFTTIQMLRINFFVATIKAQELYLYKDEATAVQINQFFDLALPMCGLISIPFIGHLLDNFTTLTILVVLLVVSVVIGVMGLLSILPATYLGIILLCLYRPFYYTAVSDFCVKVFGFDTFGTIYGAIICFSGVCNMLQLYMDRATHELFKMNPTPMNSILTGITLVLGLILIGFVKSQEKQLKRKNLELEAQEASVRGVPH